MTVLDVGEGIGIGLGFVLLAAWRTLPLAAVALVFDVIGRRHVAPRFRCAMWICVMLRLAIPVSAPWEYSLQSPWPNLFLIDTDLSSQAEVTERPVVESGTFMLSADYRVVQTVPETVQSYRAPSDPYSPAEVQSSAPAMYWDLETVVLITIAVLWLSITLFLALRIIVQHLRFQHRLSRIQEIGDQRVIDMVLRICDAMHCGRRPRVKEVDGLSVPAVFGFWTTVLCLPVGIASELSEREFQLVSKHELAHVKRRDGLLLLLASLVRAVQWGNPIAWLATFRLRDLVEQSADDLVARSTPPEGIATYGQLLVRFAAQPGENRQPATVGLLFVSAKSRLQQRIVQLNRSGVVNSWFLRVIGVAVLCVATVGGLTDAADVSVDSDHVDTVQSQEWDSSAVASAASLSPEPIIEKEEVTFDVGNALEKLMETISKKENAEIYITSLFPPLTEPNNLKIEDGKLTAEVTPQQRRSFEASLKAWERSGPLQVRVEYRTIRANMDVVRDFDWANEGVHPWGSELVTDTLNDPSANLDDIQIDGGGSLTVESCDSTTSRRPALAVKVSRFQSRLLMNRVTADAMSQVLFAPKVTLLNGQIAMISDEVQRPFVTGLRPSLNAKLQPVIESASDGWRLNMHVEVTEEYDVELKCEFTRSDLRGVSEAHLPLLSPGMAKVQVPDIARTTIRSGCRLEEGQSLLLLSPETYRTGAEESSMATFHLITPTVIPDSFGEVPVE